MPASRLFRLLSLLAALAAASCSQLAPAPAPNLTGTWTWTYDGGAAGTPVTHTYTFKQNGETLTGTFRDTYDETTAEISNGKIHDGNVSFSVDRPFAGASIAFTFTGALQDDTIKGTASWTAADQPTTADWLAKRAPQ